MAKVISTLTTWEMDGTQHPSLTGPLTLVANVPTEVVADQVDYLTSLYGVVLAEDSAPAEATPETPDVDAAPEQQLEEPAAPQPKPNPVADDSAASPKEP